MTPNVPHDPVFLLRPCLIISPYILQISVHVPDMSVVKAIQKISWTAAGGMMDLLKCSQEEIHKAFDKVRNFAMELWKTACVMICCRDNKCFEYVFTSRAIRRIPIVSCQSPPFTRPRSQIIIYSSGKISNLHFFVKRNSNT
jgi:hypothetical protein